MDQPRHCPNCDAELPSDAMEGVCPKCMAQVVFGEGEASAGKGGKVPDLPDKTVKMPESDITVERAGMMIGRYKLLEEIGEGGFGLVYMAEQVEPMQRKVALKIIKAGMDTRAVVARFEAERQALALMDHPYIARVLDAGTTKAGRPYFVMELVRGIPITEFCDQKKLSTSERLELFMTVCQAVQHAHQKGIIHRDLKPSNVLVTLQDGKPVPKVIDFGVAKALGQKLTEKTLFTGFTHMIGTPVYMSPEQAEMSGLDVDTRSDIYSLGVLLYELLTGGTPFDRETLAKAALDEVRRMIRETEPPKPSTCLQTLGDRLTDVAECRHTEPAALNRLVRGDLDWIVMKCLEKDRSRRYETANGLAMDVQRHLDQEPVVAAAPRPAYRARKFIRRNRAAIAVAASMVLLLIAGAIGSAWQAIRATRAETAQSLLRREAETEATKATAISEFLQDMVQAADPNEHRGQDYTVREMLDDFSESLPGRFDDTPEVRAALHATIGQAYWGLRLHENALVHLQKALALRSEVFGSESTEVADSHLSCAWVLFELNSDEQSESHAREAIRIYRQLGQAGQEGLLSAFHAHQRVLGELKRFGEGDAALEEALTVLPAGSDHPTLASMIATKAHGLRYQGRHREAEATTREALAMHRRTRETNDFEIAWSLYELAQSLRAQDKFAKQQAVLKEALSIFKDDFSPESDPVSWTLSALAESFRSSKNWREWEEILQQQLSVARATGPREDPSLLAAGKDVVTIYFRLSEAAEAQGREADARAYREEANALLSRLPAADFGRADTYGWSQLAFEFRKRGDLRQAELLYEHCLRLMAQAVDTHPGSADYRYGLGHMHRDIAKVLRLQKRLAEAEDHLREAVVVFTELKADVPSATNHLRWEADSRQFLADVLADMEQPEEAVTECHRAVVLYLEGVERFPTSQDLRNGLTKSLARLGILSKGGSGRSEGLDAFRRASELYQEGLQRQKGLTAKIMSEHDPADPSSTRGLIKLGNSLRWRADTSELAVDLLLKGHEAVKMHGHSTAGLDTFALALALRDRGDVAEAERFFRQAADGRRASWNPVDNNNANPLRALASLLQAQGRADEAQGLYLEELQTRKERLGKDDPLVTEWLFEYAEFLRRHGKPDVAYALVQEELSRQKIDLSGDDPRIADWGINLGKLMLAQGKHEEAAALFRKGAEHADPGALNGVAWPMATSPNPKERNGRIAIELAKKAVEATNRKDYQIVDTLAAAYAEAGQFGDAVRVQEEAVALIPSAKTNLINDLQSRLLLYRSGVPYREYWREASRLRKAGELDEAEPLLLRELEMRRKIYAAGDPLLAGYLANLAHLLVDNNKFTEAEPYAKECVKIRDEKLSDNWLRFNAHSLLGASLLGQKQYAEAEPLLISGYEGMKLREETILASVRQTRLKEGLERVVELYDAWDKPEQAAEWRGKLAKFSQSSE